MRTAPASIDSHEGIRTLIEGLQGVVQIKDDLAVHGAWSTVYIMAQGQGCMYKKQEFGHAGGGN